MGDFQDKPVTQGVLDNAQITLHLKEILEWLEKNRPDKEQVVLLSDIVLETLMAECWAEETL